MSVPSKRGERGSEAAALRWALAFLPTICEPLRDPMREMIETRYAKNIFRAGRRFERKQAGRRPVARLMGSRK